MGVLLAWASNYPITVDTIGTNFPTLADGVHDIVVSHPNALATAVVGIENVIGGLRNAVIQDPLSLTDGDSLIWVASNSQFEAGTPIGHIDTKVVDLTGLADQDILYYDLATDKFLVKAMNANDMAIAVAATWNDATGIAATTVDGAVEEVVTDLAGDPGSDRVGSAAIAGATYSQAGAGSIYDALVTLFGAANTNASDISNHLADATAAHAASAISNTPAGNITATDVQAAINELDGEKLGLAVNSIITGNNTFNGISTFGALADFNSTVTVDGLMTISTLLTLARTGDENALISATDTPTDHYNLLFEFAIDGTNGIYARFYSYDADGFVITINCAWGGSSWSSDYSSAASIMYYMGTVSGLSFGEFYKTATASTWLDTAWTHFSDFNNNGEISTTSTNTFTVQAAAEGHAINGAGEYAGATVSFGRKLAAAPTSYSYTAIANLNQSTESVSTTGDSQYGAAMFVNSAAAGRFYSRGTVVVTP